MEVISPQHLAYDRPSAKFLSFLKQYYNLYQFIPQANNFVVFKEYGLQNLELGSFF
jgi:alpha-tubulin N-acetyltransferase 1